MNENVKVWADALRSGEFQQGTSYLSAIRPVNALSPMRLRHCCMGVGCMVAGIEGDPANGSHIVYGVSRDGRLPPAEFIVWLGLDSAPSVGTGGGHRLRLNLPHHAYPFRPSSGAGLAEDTLGWTWLDTMNDIYHLRFDQIADLIERFGVTNR
jgi:hypothetical protein